MRIERGSLLVVCVVCVMVCVPCGTLLHLENVPFSVCFRSHSPPIENVHIKKE